MDGTPEMLGAFSGDIQGWMVCRNCKELFPAISRDGWYADCRKKFRESESTDNYRLLVAKVIFFKYLILNYFCFF